MSKPTKRTKSPSFVMLEKKELLQSKAWKALSGSAVKVFIALREKAPYGYIKNAAGQGFKKAYSSLIEDAGLSIQTVRNALIELSDKGFIDLVEQGGLKSGGYSMNTYALSLRFFKYDTPEFEKGTMRKEKRVTDRGWGRQWNSPEGLKKRRQKTKNAKIEV